MNSAVAIAGCGVVSATGLGPALLQAAVAANRSHFQTRECVLGKIRLAIAAGFVPDEVTAQLRDAMPAHARSRAFLFAAAALAQAVAEVGQPFASLPAGRRGFVLSTTKANIDALDQTVAGQDCPASAQRQIQPALLAQDLAAHADCGGPVQCISTACISGLLGLQQGAALIRRGRADGVLGRRRGGGFAPPG